MEDKIGIVRYGRYGRTNLGTIFEFILVQNSKNIIYEDKVALMEDGQFTNKFYYFKKMKK